jgi:hypothetical protein
MSDRYDALRASTGRATRYRCTSITVRMNALILQASLGTLGNRARVGGAVACGVAIGAATCVYAANALDDPPTVSARVSSTSPGPSPSQTLSAAPSVPSLSADTVGDLRRQGTDVAVVAEAVEQPSVSARQAQARAGGAEAPTKEISLARVTVRDYGVLLEQDPSKPQRIRRLIEDRLTWVVLLGPFDFPVFGPIEPKHDLPSTYKADAVVLIDPQTGEILRTESL